MALFNLSMYATAYVKDGEAYGVVVRGHRTNDEGEKKFANIWVPMDDGKAKITKRPDGSYVLSVKLIEVKKKVKGADADGAEKKGTKKKNAPKVEEDDEEYPF